MKIFCHIPRENWIVDRMGLEYKSNSMFDVSFDSIENDTDLIWLLGSWCWKQIPMTILESKKVVCTIHHEVPWKFDEKRKQNFLERDKIVNNYLTYNEDTKILIESLSKKPVKIIPHWINSKIWKKIDSLDAKKKLKLPEDKFLIGSFQRDTEGFDLKTPKLEKGPDIFVKKVLEISKLKDVHVVLAGWRRQYVINELKKNSIEYSYFELPNNDTINILYNSLDLYIVSSRCEGGPQAIFECAYLKKPIISTPTGQYKFLAKECIYEHNEEIKERKLKFSVNAIDKNHSNVSHLQDYNHIKNYDKFFESLCHEKED